VSRELKAGCSARRGWRPHLGRRAAPAGPGVGQNRAGRRSGRSSEVGLRRRREEEALHGHLLRAWLPVLPVQVVKYLRAVQELTAASLLQPDGDLAPDFLEGCVAVLQEPQSLPDDLAG